MTESTNVYEEFERRVYGDAYARRPRLRPVGRSATATPPKPKAEPPSPPPMPSEEPRLPEPPTADLEPVDGIEEAPAPSPKAEAPEETPTVSMEAIEALIAEILTRQRQLEQTLYALGREELEAVTPTTELPEGTSPAPLEQAVPPEEAPPPQEPTPPAPPADQPPSPRHWLIGRKIVWRGGR